MEGAFKINNMGDMKTMETELIKKSYYKTMIGENDKRHPIEILGEMYVNEMEKERPNLGSIRYAQGEVYFVHNDFETAIFKWENIMDEDFVPWAQKNIGDTHFEMGFLETAEEFYKAVQTDSLQLKTEVLLQLFSLYIKQDNQEKAIDAIKEAVRINPDYAYVTEIARRFFEDGKDWPNAIELAVNEAIRTESLLWFEVLEGYVERGITTNITPSYFQEALEKLLLLDKSRFESLTHVLWNSYKQSDFYFIWLQEVNQLLLNNNLDKAFVWKKLSSLYKGTYFELISGEFLISDISELMKSHLTNWFEISSVSDTIICSSSILAWNDIFPSELDASFVNEASLQLANFDGYENGRKDGVKLYEAIEKWAENEGVLHEFSMFMLPLLEENNLEVASPSKLRDIIKSAIEFLIGKRIEVENNILEAIQWNEELLSKLNETHHQLLDMEMEEARVLKHAFANLKNEWKQYMMNTIPEILRNCSDIVKEDSDFRKLHVNLNDEMNRRIAEYMESTAISNFKSAIQEWLVDCEAEFHDSQTYLEEMSEQINLHYGEEWIGLHCDFKVLEDWQRDLDRIARGMVHVDKVNIMMRNNPSQLLLKSAGKIFGSISKNSGKLHTRYINFIESEDYSAIANEMIHPFIQQLELFEGSLEWDISKFFSAPLDVLNSVREEVKTHIEGEKDSLDTLRTNPEIYRDPLTLFELKLRQYEFINSLNK